MGRELTQFKSGAEWRGNAKGRPKGTGHVCLTTLLKRALADVQCGDNPNPGGRTSGECLVEAAIIHAVRGNAAYFKEIFDRNDGKTPDAIPEKTGEDAIKDKLRTRRATRKKPE